jgi:hypothetical protein
MTAIGWACNTTMAPAKCPAKQERFCPSPCNADSVVPALRFSKQARYLVIASKLLQTPRRLPHFLSSTRLRAASSWLSCGIASPADKWREYPCIYPITLHCATYLKQTGDLERAQTSRTPRPKPQPNSSLHFRRPRELRGHSTRARPR